jgi:chromosome segregation protein
MQDVIFNGTNTRKPASRSSVELVFDNADHRAGGQWSQFAEIAVKRVLTRDGTSSYYINNQPVRRRDVQDVFLGTGLGPRAYAIIGQGTISRIIESKPEELRLFLEEAAGVSKYKERRRETENRLHDTRENLTRVEDILRELNANLDKLEKQAEVARATTRCRPTSRSSSTSCGSSSARGEADQDRIKADADKAVNDLEVARRRPAPHRERAGDRAPGALRRRRPGQPGAGPALRSQRRSRPAGSRDPLRGRRPPARRAAPGAAEGTDRQWATRKDEAEAELENLAERGVEAEEKATCWPRRSKSRACAARLEDALRQAQASARRAARRVTQVQQQIQVLAADQRNIEEQSRQLNQRASAWWPTATRWPRPTRRGWSTCSSSWPPRRKPPRPPTPACTSCRSRCRSSTKTAAQAAGRQHQGAQAGRPVGAHGSAEGAAGKGAHRRQAASPGWPSTAWAACRACGAASTSSRAGKRAGSALRERMGSLEVSRLDMVRAFANDAPPAKLAFYHPPPGRARSRRRAAAPGRPAAPERRRPEGAAHRLAARLLHRRQLRRGAGRARQAAAGRSDLRQAAMRHAHSVSFYAQDSEQAGLLARQQEIENLEKQLRAQVLITEEARSALVRAEAAYTDASQRLVTARREAADTQGRAHELQVETLRLTQLAEQTRARSEQIAGDLAEVDALLEELQERRVAAEGRFEELDMQLADSQERHAQLDERVIEAERKLAQAREQHRSLERQAQEAQFSQRALEARRGELQRAIETARSRPPRLAAEEERARAELARLTDAAAQAGLQNALQLKSEREQALGAKRSEYDDLTAKLRASDERRLQLERELDPLRQRITDLQLKEQAARLGLEQYTQLLADAQADLEAVAKSIQAGNVRLSGMQGEIDRLHREIAALGAVNLAALDELSTARERKQFLDAQTADLNEAMTTLEDAIRKIDGETRELLGGTFKTVNEHFGRMFPELFGGGNARLVMTGEEILDSGVQVMAQPPGKKNQTIHLLSGGEKALTAIALVFAIFQLNPAPFCLLDEVDAPLDDANTERYAKLVTSMSKETQFLFISHNKIAMEMAEQLIGVTMQEQGVSRIVAVDMESAVSMAEAA